MVPTSHRATKKFFKEIAGQRPFQVHEPAFILKKYTLPNLPTPVIAIVVSSKVSKRAVDRNLIKRRLRHIFRELTPRLKPGFAMMVLVKPGSVTTPFPRLKEQVSHSLIEAQII